MSRWSLDTALAAGLLLVLGLWLLWWALALVVAVVDPRLAARFGPPLLRALLVGTAVAATITPAHAQRASPVGILDGLPMPERPVTGTPTPAVPPEPEPEPDPLPPAAHVVQPGDSLWAIVRERSPEATDAAIATAVTRWHAANRDVIGPDPDLIHPGQRLVPPGAS